MSSKSHLPLLILAALAAGAPAARAAMNESPRAVTDAIDAFRGLTPRGEWLGFYPGMAPFTPNPTPAVNAEQHYQGIQRSPRSGGPPILYLTRTGDIDDPGNPGGLQVVQMTSRTTSGERMRSNRLVHGAETQNSPPPHGDEVIRFIPYFDYEHPGGMQMMGDVLAVPLEGKHDNAFGLPEGRILFYDCQQPDDPRLLPARLDIFGHEAGVIGLTRLPDGHFLLVVGWGDGDYLEFYRSTRPSFLDPAMRFELHDVLSASEIEDGGFWRTGKTTPQTLNFLPQRDGRVFLIGSSNSHDLAPFLEGPDEMFLWEISGWAPTQEIGMDFVAAQPRHLRSEGEDSLDVFAKQEANFNGAGGAYVSPTGELIYYGASYYNEGPGRSAQMAELHHVHVNHRRRCGPQLRENHLGGPYGIPEGATLRLDGAVHVVEPWVTMFGQPGLSGPMVTIDAIDQQEDDYADFKALDGSRLDGVDGFNDDLESFIWCGEPGTILRLFDDDHFVEGNARNVEREGTGVVQRVNLVDEDFIDEATSARLSWIGAPLHEPFVPRPRTYSWDLDGDGVFESPGLPGGRAAEIVAGPGTHSVDVSMRFGEVEATTRVDVFNLPPGIRSIGAPASVREGELVRVTVEWFDAVADGHVATVAWGDGRTDTVLLGVSAGGTFTVQHVYADDGPVTLRACVSDGEVNECRTAPLAISNAAPVLTLGGDVTTSEGSLVDLRGASFGDGGTLDTHRASVDWGDGSGVESAAVVESPFGPPGDEDGMSGTFAASHVYADDGTYIPRVCVRDDEGAEDCGTFRVIVRNAAPVVAALPDRLVREGAVVVLPPRMFSDAGTLDTHEASVDWGDGTGVVAALVDESPFGPPGALGGLVGSLVAEHVYADDGAYDVVACVKDDDGAQGCGTLRIVVTNVAPSLRLPATASLDEGSRFRLPPDAFADAGTLDTHVATVDFGDGTGVGAARVVEAPFGPPGSPDGLVGSLIADHVYADDGTYRVEACITDDDGGRTCATTVMTVRNVAPVVDAGGDMLGIEGATVTLSRATFHDAGTLDTHVASIHWGDELPAVAGVVTEAPYGPPGSIDGLDGRVFSQHVYGDDGTYTVEACISDDDGATACAAAVVVVRNRVPQLMLDASGLVSFPGGEAFLLQDGEDATWQASGRDEGSDDLTFAWRATDRRSGDMLLAEDDFRCNDPSGMRCPDAPNSSQSDHFPMLADSSVVSAAVDRAGVVDLALELRDDDGGLATAGGVMLVTGDSACGRGPGGWRHAVQAARGARRDARLSEDEVTRALGVAAFASAAFPELLGPDDSDAAVLDAAQGILGGGRLGLPGDAPSEPRARALRAALAAWLDFASGAVAWDQEIRPMGMTFAELITQVEATLLDVGASQADLGEAERLALAVNESRRPGGCGRR